MYEREPARRILAGHLSNLYAGLVAVVEVVGHIRNLAELAAGNADVELHQLGHELADQLEGGLRPALILPQLRVQVVPPGEEPTGQWDQDQGDQVAPTQRRADLAPAAAPDPGEDAGPGEPPAGVETGEAPPASEPVPEGPGAPETSEEADPPPEGEPGAPDASSAETEPPPATA